MPFASPIKTPSRLSPSRSAQRPRHKTDQNWRRHSPRLHLRASSTCAPSARGTQNPHFSRPLSRSFDALFSLLRSFANVHFFFSTTSALFCSSGGSGGEYVTRTPKKDTMNRTTTKHQPSKRFVIPTEAEERSKSKQLPARERCQYRTPTGRQCRAPRSTRRKAPTANATPPAKSPTPPTSAPHFSATPAASSTPRASTPPSPNSMHSSPLAASPRAAPPPLRTLAASSFTPSPPSTRIPIREPAETSSQARNTQSFVAPATHHANSTLPSTPPQTAPPTAQPIRLPNLKLHPPPHPKISPHPPDPKQSRHSPLAKRSPPIRLPPIRLPLIRLPPVRSPPIRLRLIRCPALPLHLPPEETLTRTFLRQSHPPGSTQTPITRPTSA